MVSVLLLAAWWSGDAFSQQTAEANGKFVVETVGGEAFSGTGVQKSGGKIVLAGDAAREFEIDEVVGIETGAAETKASDKGQKILFVTGGGLRGVVDSVSASSLEFVFGDSPVSIGLEAIAGVVWTDSQDVQNLLNNPSAEADRVVVEGASGSVIVSGLFEGMNTTQLSIQYQGQSRSVDRAKIQAILPARISVPTKQDVAATVTMSDGQSFRGKVFAMDSESVTVSVMQQEIKLPVDAVSTIAFASDRILRLTELEPVSVSEEVMFAPAREWKRNKSVSGNPIRLNDGSGDGSGKSYGNGLGMQARTQMIFANEKQFDRFAALVGIDLETEGRGDCLVSVRGDGIVLWSARLQGGQPALPVNIDIAGMKQIELLVELGEQFDLSDHVDWADARFLRTR